MHETGPCMYKLHAIVITRWTVYETGPCMYNLRAFVIRRGDSGEGGLHYDARTKHRIMHNCYMLFLPLSYTGYKFLLTCLSEQEYM